MSSNLFKLTCNGCWFSLSVLLFFHLGLSQSSHFCVKFAIFFIWGLSKFDILDLWHLITCSSACFMFNVCNYHFFFSSFLYCAWLSTVAFVILKVLALRRPLLHKVLDYEDEFFALLMLVLETHSLRTTGFLLPFWGKCFNLFLLLTLFACIINKVYARIILGSV